MSIKLTVEVPLGVAAAYAQADTRQGAIDALAELVAQRMDELPYRLIPQASASPAPSLFDASVQDHRNISRAASVSSFTSDDTAVTPISTLVGDTPEETVKLKILLYGRLVMEVRMAKSDRWSDVAAMIEEHTAYPIEGQHLIFGTAFVWEGNNTRNSDALTLKILRYFVLKSAQLSDSLNRVVLWMVTTSSFSTKSSTVIFCLRSSPFASK